MASERTAARASLTPSLKMRLAHGWPICKFARRPSVGIGSSASVGGVDFQKWLRLLVTVMLLALAPLRNVHAGSFRVIVRITSEMSRALAERIRGQTSDLLL